MDLFGLRRQRERLVRLERLIIKLDAQQVCGHAMITGALAVLPKASRETVIAATRRMVADMSFIPTVAHRNPEEEQAFRNELSRCAQIYIKRLGEEKPSQPD